LGIPVKNKQEWMELCERAAFEQDSAKLLELVREINDLLEEKHKRLAQIQPWDRPEETGGQEAK
jgi:hypothetical protein